jgi:hypothetical protein
MPAVIDLRSNTVVFQSMSDAECLREKYRLQHDSPSAWYKLTGMEFGGDDVSHTFKRRSPD